MFKVPRFPNTSNATNAVDTFDDSLKKFNIIGNVLFVFIESSL